MTDDEHWALWRADQRATVFQSPAWQSAWWRHLGGGERRDVTIRDATGRLIAALPLFVWNDAGTRRLVPVAAGHSDYCDALITDADAVPALWEAMAEYARDCDEVLLPDLRAGSPLLAAAPAGWHAEDSAAEVCPAMALPPDGDVLAGLSRSRRRKVVHDRNRAAQLGGVTSGFATGDAVPEALDALFALHAERWAAAGEPGVLASAAVQAFHREAAPALDAAGLLRCVVVRHDARIVAVLLGFAAPAGWCSYINGVSNDPPGQSFGTLAFAHLIEAAAAAGAPRFDFLRGEEPYKYGWGAEPTRTTRRVLRRA